MAYRGKQSDPFYHSSAWLAVRKNALLRDHEICQICLRAFQAGLMREPRRATIVHHLIPHTERPDLELDLQNLQSVCAICHNQEHPEKGGVHGADKSGQTRSKITARIVKIQGE